MFGRTKQILLSVVFVSICQCKDDNLSEQCAQYCHVYIECYEEGLIEFYQSQGWTWNESEFLESCKEGCNAGDVPTGLVDCYLEHTCAELYQGDCDDYYPDGGIDPYESDICYTGVVVQGEQTATSFDDVIGEGLFYVDVESGTGDNITSYEKTDTNGRYGESSMYGTPYCSAQTYANMSIEFSLPGCETATYQT